VPRQQAQAAAATAKAEMAKQEAGAQRKAGATSATRQSPWTNSLGMVFVPVPGVEVLFCIWDVRVKDYRAYAGAAGGCITTGRALVLRKGMPIRW